MKFEHITEEREYKYGPAEKFNTLEEVKAHVRDVRNKVLTNISLSGFNRAVEKIDEEPIKNGIKLTVVLKYPVDLFN